MACRVCLYALNVAIAVDQGINAVTGGSPRQTVSSRLGRATQAGKGWAGTACRVLGWIFRDPQHCFSSIIEDDAVGELLDLAGKGGPMTPGALS
jgi:hypothetical protein